MPEPICFVVGYYNYADVQMLEQVLEEHNQRLAQNPVLGGRPFRLRAANQDAQRVFDDAIKEEADVVLLSPEITGYRHTLIRDLLLHPERPIPTVGLVAPRSDDGRAMTANGAKGYVVLPLDETGATRALGLCADAVEQALRERLEGRVQLGLAALPTHQQRSFSQKLITVYVPKGGGSTRTTIAVNLAVALSHATLANCPTLLVDLDMAKGDCHTLLGMTADEPTALRYGWPLLDRGLYELIINAVALWPRQGTNAVNPVLLRQFLAPWGKGQSQLTLLPGLMYPHQAAAEEFADWERLYQVARQILKVARNLYTFVVVDIGQDYNLPLHRAAIAEADEVLVTVPPSRTALVDTVNALPALRNQFGAEAVRKKFKLVITAYDPAFGITEAEITDAVDLTKIARIPFDALVAHQAVNTARPFVLDDQGPLGDSIRELAAVYYPDLVQLTGKGSKGLGRTLKRLLVRDA